MLIFGTILIFLFQVVFAGKQPTKKELEDYCNRIEKVRPNLELRWPTRITGRITDIVGSPLKHSQLEIRRYVSSKKQEVVKDTVTDDHGRFDVGVVAPGKYRFLPSPNRVFKQPIKLECAGENCELDIVLQLNPTDQPESICPIR